MKKLKELRVKLGFTQKEIADALGYSGVSQISSWENGNNPIPENRYAQLSEVFGIPEDKLRVQISDFVEDKARAWRDKILRSHEEDDVKLLLACLPMFEDDGVVSVTYRRFADEINVHVDKVANAWPKMMSSEFVKVIGDPEKGVLRLKY